MTLTRDIRPPEKYTSEVTTTEVAKTHPKERNRQRLHHSPGRERNDGEKITLGDEKLSLGNTAPYSWIASLICSSSSGNAKCGPSSSSSCRSLSSWRVLFRGLGRLGQPHFPTNDLKRSVDARTRLQIRTAQIRCLSPDRHGMKGPGIVLL